MSGAGNDFIVIDNRSLLISEQADFARRVCDRRWGVGADGILLLEPSQTEAYTMAYYNADGSHGGMCGNGGRCIALFALQSGIAPANHSFRALDYVYAAEIEGKYVSLKMKNPQGLRTGLKIHAAGHTMTGHFLDTGSPHVVVFVENLDKGTVPLDQVDVAVIGPALRHHSMFKPEGTNVNFVETDRFGLCKIRTYERGVEAETLACGTGSIAVAVIASRMKEIAPPVRIRAKSGEELTVNFRTAGEKVVDVELRGQAVVTFEGTVDLS
jgi:diaminopimelate epimerase